MSEAPQVLASPFVDAAKFGFTLSRAPDGWRWQAYDLLGQVTEEGVASNRAQAAAYLIRALARA